MNHALMHPLNLRKCVILKLMIAIIKTKCPLPKTEKDY